MKNPTKYCYLFIIYAFIQSIFTLAFATETAKPAPRSYYIEGLVARSQKAATIKQSSKTAMQQSFSASKGKESFMREREVQGRTSATAVNAELKALALAKAEALETGRRVSALALELEKAKGNAAAAKAEALAAEQREAITATARINAKKDNVKYVNPPRDPKIKTKEFASAIAAQADAKVLALETKLAKAKEIQAQAETKLKAATDANKNKIINTHALPSAQKTTVPNQTGPVDSQEFIITNQNTTDMPKI